MEYKLGLIGYPIKHSLSPWIHNRFLELTNTKGTYTILETEEESIVELVEVIKEKKYKGFNVTLPFKQKIIPYLDELDDTAKYIGAVNTVLNKSGRLIGFNTDGIGYLRSLQQYYPELLEDKQKHILILGAGGASRGIFYVLNHSGYKKIDIANRTIDKAKSIAKLKINDTQTNVITLEQAENRLHHYDLIIQTTNVGMKPDQASSLINVNNIRESAIVSDIIYQPIMTKFLKEASNKGARIHQGHTMLLYQAQFAFEIWFGEQPKIGNMDLQLKQLLEG